MRRFFFTSSKSLQRSASEIRGAKLVDVKNLTGDIDKDGLNRFEMDFFETASWTKELLEAMQNDAEELKKGIRKFKQPCSDTPLCLQTRHFYSYDFSKPQSDQHPVKLHVKLSDLQLDSKQLHKLKVLSGSAYDPYTDVFTVQKDDKRTNSNGQSLLHTFSKLLEEVKTGLDTLQDVCVDLQHIKSNIVGLQFPKEWEEEARVIHSKNEKLKAELMDTSSDSAQIPSIIE